MNPKIISQNRDYTLGIHGSSQSFLCDSMVSQIVDQNPSRDELGSSACGQLGDREKVGRSGIDGERKRRLGSSLEVVRRSLSADDRERVVRGERVEERGEGR